MQRVEEGLKSVFLATEVLMTTSRGQSLRENVG